MKNETLKRITNLKRLIDRRVEPEIVMAEVDTIFNNIEKLESNKDKFELLTEMGKITLDLARQAEELSDMSVLEILGHIAGAKNKEKTEIIDVNIVVERYLNATHIEIDKKIPYSELLSILNETIEGFEDSTDELMNLGFSSRKNKMKLEYISNKYNPVYININKWNLSEEVAKVYVEGFFEYLQK